MDFTENAIYVGSLLGIALTCILLASNFNRFREKKFEIRALRLMAFLIILGCLADMLALDSDRKSMVGALIGNTAFYGINMGCAYLWLFFLASHLKIHISPIHKLLLQGILFAGLIILLINIFKPIVFVIDPQTLAYTRKGYYWWIFYIIDYFFVLDSILMYIICKHRGGAMKSFPILVYLAPLFLASIAQIFQYDIVTPCFAIALAGILSSLQSDMIFRDKLTKAYNYAYFEVLEHRYRQDSCPKISGIMLNLNGFKNINRNYGRKTANMALRATTKILFAAAGELGTVIRYTSDEFIIFLNTQNDMALNLCISRINSGFAELNRESQRPYKISACFGKAIFERGMNMDSFIDTLSRQLDEAKSEFYSVNEKDRRRD